MNNEMTHPIRVNGEEVSEALIQQEFQMLRERYAAEMSYQEMDAQQARIESDARENAVERVLLMQQARKEVQSVRPAEVEARFTALKQQHGGDDTFHERFELEPGDELKIKADIEDAIRLELYFDVTCKEVARPVEADAQAYYETHRDEFMVPEMVHAAHIVQSPSPDVPLERVYADLLNVRERITAGEDFETLANEYSDCQSGDHDLGYFARGQMVPSFEDIAFSTAAGEVSDVFQSEFGYHILKVYDHRPESCRKFEEVRYDIEAMLFDAKKNEAIGAVADELRTAAAIENLEIVEDRS